MIETIYSSDSEDADRTNKVQNSFKMPKNIRQVGKGSAVKKIYVEDYVMTFIKQLLGGDFSGYKIAVLVGQSVRMDNCRNIFVSGAVEVRNIDTTGDIIFTNDVWTDIYEDIKKYFVEAEIVGWFIGGPGYLLEDEDKILKIHVDNFAGQDKTLLTYDNMEREETFYSYENNKLCKQEGYYIYYEKNEEMQTYMIDHKKEQSSDASYDDRVSREIRTVLQNKKPTEEESKSVTRLMYAAGTLLAVIVLVVGAAILSNYDQMKNMKNTLDYLTKNMEKVQAFFIDNENTQAGADMSRSEAEDADASADNNDISAADNSSEQSLDVKVVPGDVKPLEKNDSQKGSKDNENKEQPSTGEDLAGETDKTSEKTTQGNLKEDDAEGQKEAAIPDQVKYYTVVSGDTLADISYKLYHTYTKVKTIMELNKIENKDFIYVGQRLIVP